MTNRFTPARCRISIVAACVVLLTGTAFADTVRGRIRPSNDSETYRFAPNSGAHVELTLMWTKKEPILNLLVECFDEIGSHFFTAVSESSGPERIERMEFGGFFGASCTATVFELDQSGVTTLFLLNLRYAFGEPVTKGGAAAARPRLESVPTEAVPGLEERLAKHRERLRRARR